MCSEHLNTAGGYSTQARRDLILAFIIWEVYIQVTTHET